MIRSGVAATAALAATLAFGVSGAVAAPSSRTPLAKVAAHDHMAVPSALAHAIKHQVGLKAHDAIAGASQTSTHQQELQASDGMPLDLLGLSVSLTADGHTALVGAPGRTVGAAYVFVDRGGKWSQSQVLQSPQGSATDTFGWSVSLAGDGTTALVGAYSANDVAGTVYSYSLKNGRYVLDGHINAPDGAPGDEFGYAVSLSGLGNVALIGAPDHNGFQGAAYVFAHTGSSWHQLREYTDPVTLGEAYGASVSEAADGLAGVVGAPFANGAEGAAYAFSELGSSQQTLVGDPAAQPFLFGLSVSINGLGNRVLVGSPSANLGSGAAFVFDQGKGGYTESQELVQSDSTGADLFGYSVSINYLGNAAVIGSPERNATDGSAYTFAGNGRLTQRRELPDPAAAGQGDEYGDAVAISGLGNELLIGAPYTNNARGAAWAVAN